jgi:ribonuclease P protein component
VWVQRRFRLRRSGDFERVRRTGRKHVHPLVVLIASANEMAQLHVGVVAGRTVGTAVERNRAKRLLRSAMQSLTGSLQSGWDLVLIARPATPASNYFEVREALVGLLRRAELTRNS